MSTNLPTSLPPSTLHLVHPPASPSTSTWPGIAGAGSSVSSRILYIESQQADNVQKHRINVLDSSFNPPTLAHLALATLSPSPAPTSNIENVKDYSAHLLLFSLTNVEKKASASDPTLQQRLHLISLLLPYLPPNTAIGLINEPTFVGKSQTIYTYLSSHSSQSSQSTEEVRPELSFVIGTDTLTRFFDPRFYTATPGGMDEALGRFFEEEGSRVISARRGGVHERKIEDAVVGRDEVKRWVDKGKLALAGTGDEEWVGMSSTKIRHAVQEEDWEAVRRLTVPEIADYIKDQGLYRA